MQPSLARHVVAEGLGTAFLVAAVVGSGIMAERLAGGNAAIALSANTLATGHRASVHEYFFRYSSSGCACVSCRANCRHAGGDFALSLAGPASRDRRGIMKNILFACVHNAGRSQMAAAWFNALANPAEAVAISAGTEPAGQVHPEVLEVMREVGIDLSAARPQFLSEELAQRSTLLITMGCGESCPHVPGLEREDWPLPDPKGQSIEAVRVIRDEIQRRVQDLLARHGIKA